MNDHPPESRSLADVIYDYVSEQEKKDAEHFASHCVRHGFGGPAPLTAVQSGQLSKYIEKYYLADIIMRRGKEVAARMIYREDRGRGIDDMTYQEHKHVEALKQISEAIQKLAEHMFDLKIVAMRIDQRLEENIAHRRDSSEAAIKAADAAARAAEQEFLLTQGKIKHESANP